MQSPAHRSAACSVHRSAVLEFLPYMQACLRSMFQAYRRSTQDCDVVLLHAGSDGETAPEWQVKYHSGTCGLLSKWKYRVSKNAAN